MLTTFFKMLYAFVDTPIALLNKPDGVFRGIW